jgi:hypothetical protein
VVEHGDFTCDSNHNDDELPFWQSVQGILRDYLREALEDDTQQRLNTPRLC